MDDWIHIPPSCTGKLQSNLVDTRIFAGLCTFPFIETLIIIVDYQRRDVHYKTLIHLEEFDAALVAESIEWEVSYNQVTASELNEIIMVIQEKSTNASKRMRRSLRACNLKYKLKIVPDSQDSCGLAVPLNGEPFAISKSKLTEWISMPYMTQRPKYCIIRHPQELQFCLEKGILFGMNNKDTFSPCITHNGMHWELSASQKYPLLHKQLNLFMLSFGDKASLHEIKQKMRDMFRSTKFEPSVLNKACLSAKLLKNKKQNDIHILFEDIIIEICHSVLVLNVLQPNQKTTLLHLINNIPNIDMFELLKLYANVEKYTNFHQLMNYFSFAAFGAELQSIAYSANLFYREGLVYYQNNDFLTAKKCFWNVLVRRFLVYCVPSNALLCGHYNYAASCQNARDENNASNYMRLAYYINEKLLINDLGNIQLIQRKVTILRRLKQSEKCISEYVEKGETYLKSMINYKELSLRKKSHKILDSASYKYPFEALLDMKRKRLNLKERECEQCHRKESEKSLKLCRKCKAVFFCSRHCQKISWKYTHKYLCVV